MHAYARRRSPVLPYSTISILLTIVSDGKNHDFFLNFGLLVFLWFLRYE